MNKKLIWKIALTVFLTLLASWTLYPPHKTLKPGIDLAGGTSIIYQIDTQGLKEAEKKDLSQRMITVLRRRIDPANIQNLIWRPQGNTRFEIQMPLASQEARDKRDAYDSAEKNLLAENIGRPAVVRSLKKTPDERSKDFAGFAQGDPNKLKILEKLAKVYDERGELQKKRDELVGKLKDSENKLSAAGVDIEQVKARQAEWARLDEQKLADALKEFLEDSQDNFELLSEYAKTFAEWFKVVNQLTDEVSGKNIQYTIALRTIDQLNLTQEQLNYWLELPAKSSRRKKGIAALKERFPDRAEKIDKVVDAFDGYRPFRGRLDDPQDLKRMLKGAGILEFRILPTVGQWGLDAARIDIYKQDLKEKGPTRASDKEYVWCEIEDAEGFRGGDVQGGLPTVGEFGGKKYVLASNQENERILRGSEGREWKLVKAEPTSDRDGRRAIGFFLDERGGRLFSNVTGRNIGRPLCILLDGFAISAPHIQDRIRRDGIITGRFSETDVKDMVNKLNAGSLPRKLIEQPISENTIGPSIGADNRNKGIRAGLIGLVTVMVVMAVYYIFLGSIADVALLMNILFVLAIMAGLRATFTLPGIAGIILTIGMSVDANVLIYERIREEQERGSSLRIAIANGYQRAFSTIFDANLTTFITAAILYWVASEEIKGFAIVLMLGIGSSMFTALFVTRIVLDVLLARRVIKERLVMLRLIRRPNVNWMKARPVFFAISTVLILAGLFVFFTRDDTNNNKYDIEFTGGTNVQISLKEGVNITRQDVEARIRSIGEELNKPALASANVYSVGESESSRQFEINTTETNKTIVALRFPQKTGQTISGITGAIKKAQQQGRFSSVLSNLTVTQDTNDATSFSVSTSQMSQVVVTETLKTAFPDANISEPKVEQPVNDAILAAFENELEIQQDLRPKIATDDRITDQDIESYPELAEFIGGIRIACEIERSASLGEIEQRLKDLRFRPDTRDLNWAISYRILNSKLNLIRDPNQPLNSFVYVSVDPEAGFRQLSEDEWSVFRDNERKKVTAATTLETSLPRVRQFDPSIGAEARTRALIAIVLSLFAIVSYIWFRFGDIRYGLTAIVALVHDVCITLGAITACTYIAGKPIGDLLLIGDFKINLAMIAAFLTLIGYSLNDTIVVFDRIRENRHKAQLKAQTITDSINQTVSRTIMTSFTTFIVVLIMYIFGGANLRGFTFAIGLGVIVGTYSSIAIAAPLLLVGKKAAKGKRK